MKIFLRTFSFGVKTFYLFVCLFVCLFVGFFFRNGNGTGGCCLLQAFYPNSNGNYNAVGGTCTDSTLNFYTNNVTSSTCNYIYLIQDTQKNHKIGHTAPYGFLTTNYPTCCGTWIVHFGNIADMSIGDIEQTYPVNQKVDSLPDGISFISDSSSGEFVGCPKNSAEAVYQVTINFRCLNNGQNYTSNISLSQNFIIQCNSAPPGAEDATLTQQAFSSDGNVVFERFGKKQVKKDNRERSKNKLNHNRQKLRWNNVIQFKSAEDDRFIESYQIYDSSEYLEEPVLIAVLPKKKHKKNYRFKHRVKGPCHSYQYQIYSVTKTDIYSKAVVVRIKSSKKKD